MRSNRCELCRFWGAERAHNDDYPLGTCRVHASPTYELLELPVNDPDRPEVTGYDVLRGLWHWTAFDDWCGDWQGRVP